MAYNPRNLLLKINEIQDIVIREKKRGATQKWIFENLIEDVYKISWPTFNNYLARNAKRELKELDKELASKAADKAARKARLEAEINSQLSLAF